ncbi:carboxypeptidase regulatory-like domain-containing protein [Candidatus Ozemobacteraceae bacterium]|nr:carboxypeptidase regulatory-like domain-containing protein [Candidatus Ozemobacteraceae bacterium]
MCKSVFFRSAVGALLLACVFTLTGCGGGGTSGAPREQATPEAAVHELIAGWKSGNSAPSISINPSAPPRVVFQTETDPTATDTLSFRDLSGNEWNFTVVSITRPSSTRAEVRTSTSVGVDSSDPAATTAYITFIMDLDEGWWYLSDMILELPAVIVVTENAIEGFVSEKGNPDIRLQGASVVLYQGQTEVARTTTDANGYYKFSNLAPGTYSLVFVGGGYETLTFTGIIVNG